MRYYVLVPSCVIRRKSAKRSAADEGLFSTLMKGARAASCRAQMGSYLARPQPEWRNWQTQWIQNPPTSRSYRFDSDLGHHIKTPGKSGGFLLFSCVRTSTGYY